MANRRMEAYQEPQMEQILLPGAELLTLTSVPGGPGEIVTPEPENGANSWLQSW